MILHAIITTKCVDPKCVRAKCFPLSPFSPFPPYPPDQKLAYLPPAATPPPNSMQPFGELISIHIPKGVRKGCGRGAEGVRRGCGGGAEGVRWGCGRGAEGVPRGPTAMVETKSRSQKQTRHCEIQDMYGRKQNVGLTIV
jgi:hypothetical protein